MGAHQRQRPFKSLLACLLCLLCCAGSVYAYDNPELLPQQQTPVVDLAKAFSENQLTNLEKSLDDYETRTGWKLRVLTQYERTPGLAVREFWGLDERSLLVAADPRGGNLLNFNVGDALYALMPRTYWVELQTRYGNQFYVKDHGEDIAILDSLNAVETCLDRGGCQFVPGLPLEQWLLTFTTSLIGGVVAGLASYPRKEGELIAWPWLLLASPLWIMLFGIFGIAPVVSRTSDLLPLLRNGLGFLGGAIAAYLFAQATLGDRQKRESEP